MLPLPAAAGQPDHALHGDVPDGGGTHLALGAALAAGRHSLADQEAVRCDYWTAAQANGRTLMA
jgi:hypothetical protein